MLAAPTEEEDQVAVVPKETVDKATEKKAEARLEERMAATREIWGGVLARWRPETLIHGGERREVKPRESRRPRRADGLGRPAFQRTNEKSGRRVLGRQAKCGREDQGIQGQRRVSESVGRLED